MQSAPDGAVIIDAQWDEDARRWWVVDSSYPGIRAEAATIEDLAARVLEQLTDLMDINEHHVTPGMLRVKAERAFHPTAA